MRNDVILITGASRGIGRATALAAAARGARVYALARSRDELEDTCARAVKAGGICEPVAADMTSFDEVSRAVQAVHQQAGRLDVVVNNAGCAPLSMIQDYDVATFDALVDLNIRGVFYAIRAAWPLMIQQKCGKIINLSSLAAQDPFPGFQAYGASKAWVNALTQALAAEGGEHGIEVYAVGPGAVDTGLLRGLFPDFPAEECLDPDDVAEFILSLLDEEGAIHESGSIIYLEK